MIGLQITQSKPLMHHLFKEPTFDAFLVVKIQLKTHIYYEIDGVMTSEDTNLEETYAPWSDYKGLLLQMLKSPKAPQFLKIIFTLTQTQTDHLLAKTESTADNIQGFVLTLEYKPPLSTLVTGTNYKGFTLSKDSEHYFDQSIQKFLDRHNIAYDI